MATGRCGHHGVIALSRAESVNADDSALAPTRDRATTDVIVSDKRRRQNSVIRTTVQVNQLNSAWPSLRDRRRFGVVINGSVSLNICL